MSADIFHMLISACGSNFEVHGARDEVRVMFCDLLSGNQVTTLLVLEHLRMTLQVA